MNKTIQLCTITLTLLLSWGTATAQITPAGAVKWHPGHYTELAWRDAKNMPSARNDAYADFNKASALRGLVVRYSWRELETSKDVYDFSSIRTLLAELKAKNKRLIILFETKSSEDLIEDFITPAYVKTPAYEGGFYKFANANLGAAKGRGIKLWNPQVYARVVKLFHELGKEFNSHTHFEGIGLAETSLSEPTVDLSITQEDNYFKNLLSLNQQMRIDFPNTMTFQFANYPRPVVQTYANAFKTMGTGFGGPDVFLQEPGLLFRGSTSSPKGAYMYHPELSGVVPLAMQVAKLNYQNTRWDGTGYQPTITELLNFSKTKLKVNYLFWVRIPPYYDKVITKLKETNQTSTPSGGLRSACPSAFPSCAN